MYQAEFVDAGVAIRNEVSEANRGIETQASEANVGQLASGFHTIQKIGNSTNPPAACAARLAAVAPEDSVRGGDRPRPLDPR